MLVVVVGYPEAQKSALEPDDERQVAGPEPRAERKRLGDSQPELAQRGIVLCGLEKGEQVREDVAKELTRSLGAPREEELGEPLDLLRVGAKRCEAPVRLAALCQCADAGRRYCNTINASGH